MSQKPIFVATHPRACSTAFERVFMTRQDDLHCFHEPFGDAYYFGPERLAVRYADNEQTCLKSGFSDYTYKTIMDKINKENSEGKRLFIKDMAQYFMPPGNRLASIAPSLIKDHPRRGVGTSSDVPNGTSDHLEVNGAHFDSTAELTNGRRGSANTLAKQPYDTPVELNNPTIVPAQLLKQFHWTFLIRHPKKSIPSYYRCCIPPLDDVTGFRGFRPDEAGYVELRRLFDYLLETGCAGPTTHGQDSQGTANGADLACDSNKVCVIDADDLLDHPQEIIQAFCENVGLEYRPEMLNWDSEESQKHATEAFEKWKGFHEDAIHSKDLKPREKKHERTDEEHYKEWVDKYGEDGAEIIRKSVEENVKDYEYLKQFCVRVS